jgi:hypothetical protein
MPHGSISCIRTKPEANATNVMIPIRNNELSKDFREASFVTLSADEGNKRSVKLIPVFVWRFHSMRSVKVKPLDQIKWEISEIIVDVVLCSVQKYISLIVEKPVGHCVDNTNTTSTGPLQRGKIDVIRKLKQNENVWIRPWCTHWEQLPYAYTRSWRLVAKIYKHFHSYSIRVTELQRFCQVADTAAVWRHAFSAVTSADRTTYRNVRASESQFH